MARPGRWLVVLIMYFTWLVWSGQASAIAPEIHDEGKFFSPDALKTANEEVRRIARKSGLDLLIETYAQPAGEQADKVKSMSSEEKSKFFHTWARQRIDAVVVHGVYVLICKSPPYIFVDVTAKAGSSFDETARKKMQEILIKDFREKHFDEGLAAAVAFVSSKLTESGSK